MKVRDVMNTNVKVINKNETLLEAARIMREMHCGSLPVENNEKLVGMLTDRDIAVRAVADSSDITKDRVEKFMSKGIKFCFEEDSVEDVMKNMGDIQLRRLPVLNNNKRLVGIVSLGDLAKNTKESDSLLETYRKVCH